MPSVREGVVTFPSGRSGGLPKGKKWWVVRDSNSRHLRCKRSALPTELTTRETRFRQNDLPWQASFETNLHAIVQMVNDPLPAPDQVQARAPGTRSQCTHHP